MNRIAPLYGARIQIAGSIHCGGDQDIATLVERLVTRLLSEGASIVHGSHPTLIAPIRAASFAFIKSGGTKDAITLVRSESYAKTREHLDEIRTHREFAEVQVVPTTSSSQDGLISMREWMAECSDAIVCVGGKWWDTNKANAGVPLEIDAMLERGKPGFILGAYGGAVKGYFESDASLAARLKNGLSPDDNARLASQKDLEVCVTTVTQQLTRLPLVRASFQNRRNFRILAIDGGGIRGTFPAAILAKWDDMLGSVPDRTTLVSHFDLVAGTSTGAIIAIGLSIGNTPSEILNFYKTHGPSIFQSDRSLRHWIKSKHDSRTLKSILESVFEKKTLHEHSGCRLVVPTVRATSGRSDVIVTSHSPISTAFRSISAVDAALASSAAPTYFDEANVEGVAGLEQYLDGGIWANNPVLPAIAEATGCLNVPMDRIDVLSIGTMQSDKDFTGALGGGKASWASQSVDLFFSAQQHASHTLAKSFLGGTRILRVDAQVSKEISLDEASSIDEIASRGNDTAKETFESVRSRFLDGIAAPKWERF